MQSIAHLIPSIHPIFEDFDRMYAQLSVKTEKKPLIPNQYDRSFQPLYEMFENYGHSGYIEYKNMDYKPLPVSEKDNTVIVCFSGGKDSLATVLYYLKRRYNVILYHLRGINQTYKDEHKAVETLGGLLGLPVVIEELTLRGTHDYIEHPMKNMIIANGAIQYAVRNHIGIRVAFGNFNTSSLDNDEFEICGGDCYEMWKIYQRIIRHIAPRLRILTPLENMQSTINLVLEKPNLIPYTQSCIGAYRYREKLHKLNERKYGVTLLEHRCGSCWKCCLEYCIFCDNDIFEYNDGYYKHCLNILQNTLYQETGNHYDLFSVWHHYFFYPMSKSKYLGNTNESTVI